MAKRNLIWHIGPEDLSGVLLPQLLEAAEAADFHRIAAVEANDADLDLRRAHQAAGRSRKDVEGAWAQLESKVWHAKGIWIVSTPSAHLADEDERRLAMAGLRGVKVQIVVFRTAANTDVVDAIAQRWAQPLHPERMHVIDVDGTVESAWQGLFEVAGLSVRELPESVDVLAPWTAAAGVLNDVISQSAGRADVAATAASLLAGGDAGESDEAAISRALATAAEEVVSAEQRIRELLADNERLDRKRRKHKRRLRALQEQLDEPSPEELEHVTVSA